MKEKNMWEPVSNLEELHKKAYEQRDTFDNYNYDSEESEIEKQDEQENEFNLQIYERGKER